jgi:hypothetical protein
MGFQVDREIEVVLEIGDSKKDYPKHILRMPTPAEWRKYRTIETGETEFVTTKDGGTEIRRRIGAEMIEAVEFLYDACLVDAIGYVNKDGELTERRDFVKYVPLPHKQMAVEKLLVAVHAEEEKVKN